MNEESIELAERLIALTPGNFEKRVWYGHSGSDANEFIAKIVPLATGKSRLMTFVGSYHGMTMGSYAMSGHPSQGRFIGAGNIIKLPYPYCYRCAFGMDYPGCGMFCLEFARKVLRNNTTGSLAAILVETMQGTAGNVVPPPEFIPGLQQIAREHDALFIGDEMITGFGRTGTMFGCEHTQTVPDIMTVGKGMGNGFPLSGLISTTEITSALPFSKPSSGSSSYGGNALASTAGLVTIRTIIEESLPENAKRVGEHIVAMLHELQERFPFIGYVQGKGLMIRVELVKDRRTKEPLDSRIMEFMFKESIRSGLMAMNYKASFRINPPLTITREEADQGLGIFTDTCQAVANTICGMG